MKMKKLLTAAISVIVWVLPMAIAFMMAAEPAMAQRSDRNLKENIGDVDVREVLASVL